MAIPPEFLKSFTKRLGVSDSELEVLLNTLEGEDLNAIAHKLGVQRNALQKRLGEVYRKFQIQGSGPGKFAKLQKILLEEYQKHMENLQTEPETTNSSEESSSESSMTNAHLDWGEAPVVGTFYGRDDELTQVQDYLIKERCPLVALLGMAGIGKSVFAVRLIEEIANHYDYIIWRNLALRSLPSLETLVSDLIMFFRQSNETEIPFDHPPVIADLIETFRNSRCLVILDNFESLFQEKKLTGYYQSGYENYGQLLKQIAQTRHQSSVLLLSRETPLELMGLAGEHLPTRLLTLKGLTAPTVEQFLSYQGISGSNQNTLSQLMADYSGHPMALQQIATTVQTLFHGNLKELLQTNTIFVGEVLANYFSEQLERLSPLEEKIIHQLAIAPEGLNLNEIQTNLPKTNDLSDVMTALNSLNRRCLLEKYPQNQVTYFTLIPSLKKYVSLKGL